MNEQQDPVEDVRTLAHELEQFDELLAKKDRWLILNKTDLLLEEELDDVCNDIVSRLDWQGPVYRISAVTGQGTRQLMTDIMTHIETVKAEQAQEAEQA